MKKLKTRILSLLVLASVVMCGNANADNVDIQTAKEIGAYYFSVTTGAKAPITADNLKLAQQFDNPTLCVPAVYAFNVAEGGFVVVSASDCTEPILAYSPNGSLDPKNINPACRYMLESYARLVSENQNSFATSTAQIKGQWLELKNHTYNCPELDSKGILVQAKWDQGDPDNPSYNIMCPVKNGKHCYVGCVATAMAMIIHYWKYPVKGGNDNSTIASCPWNGTTVKYKFAVDSNKFIYDSMPNQISPSSIWNYKRAVGKLGFACGVTVKMEWGLDGSGTQSTYVPNALYQWFRYSDQATYLRRDGVSDAEWVRILREEIVDNARPVYYSAYDPTGTGRDAAGHAFVIAGASSNDNKKFYINWGWNGSSNGFFSLVPASSIGAAGGYTFSQGHAMVYRIFPKSEGIEENTAFTQTPAYPNPATDYIMIPSNLPLDAALTIYSIDGKIIDQKVIPGGTQDYRLDLQNYQPGAYVYRLNGAAVKFTVQ